MEKIFCDKCGKDITGNIWNVKVDIQYFVNTKHREYCRICSIDVLEPIK